MNLRRRIHLNWRLAFAHIVINAFALGFTVFLLPGIRLSSDNTFFALIASGLIFGLLNAFIKPILQFVMFQFLFVTFGLVLIVINFILLLLLAWLTPGWFQSDSMLWTLLAALVVGLTAMIAENLLGLSPPIVDRHGPAEPPDVAPTLAATAIGALGFELDDDSAFATDENSVSDEGQGVS